MCQTSQVPARDLGQGGGWKEACGSQAPAPHLAVALKLCSSQKSKGRTKCSGQASRFLCRKAGFPLGGIGQPLDEGSGEALSAEACPSQLQARSTHPFSRNSGGISTEPLESGFHPSSYPVAPSVSWPLIYPGCRKSHISQTRISMANQWPGPRELSLVSQVMGGEARKCS